MQYTVITAFIRLMRPYQYYKNLLIGVCIVFSEQLFNIDHYISLIIGFVIMSFVSSSGYIINDIVDLEKDRKHPEKQNRPLPSNQISIAGALIGLLILNAIIVASYLVLSIQFVLFVYLLFVSTVIYSFYAKNQPILDLIFVAINYVIRAVAGCILIEETISEWLFVCGFLFALFLVLGKRYGDLEMLGDQAVHHKPVFQYYNKQILVVLLSISASSLLVSYGIYVIQSEFELLVLSLPIFVYFILSYLLIVLNSDMGKKPHEILKNKQILTSLVLLVIFGIISIYINPSNLTTL